MSNQRIFHKAVKWAYIMNCGQQGLTALFSFVLAAILGPSNFGTLAMAMVYVQFIQIFLEQGLVATLIQRKDLRSDHLDSVFWIGMAVSTILMTVSILLSRWWAAANRLPQLGPVICALSLLLPIEALDLVQRAMLQREMDFKTLSIRTNVSVAVGGVVGLAMALAGFGVWSLVGQRLVQEAAALALLWKMSQWRPRLAFKMQSVREIWAVSISNLFGRVGVFASGYADALLIGLFFGPVAVGLYQLAGRLVGSILSVATGAIQVVSLPQFSKFQHDQFHLRDSVIGCIRLTATTTVPALMGLVAVRNPLLRVLGKDWVQSAGAVRVLAFVGIIMTFQYLIGPLLQATSKPHYAAAMVWAHGAISSVTMLLAAVPLRHLVVAQQVLGIAYVRLASALVVFVPITLYFLSQICQISLVQFIRAVTPSFTAAGGAAAIVRLLQISPLSYVPTMLALTAEVGAGALVATAILLSLDSRLRSSLLEGWAASFAGKKGAENTVVP